MDMFVFPSLGYTWIIRYLILINLLTTYNFKWSKMILCLCCSEAKGFTVLFNARLALQLYFLRNCFYNFEILHYDLKIKSIGFSVEGIVVFDFRNR